MAISVGKESQIPVDQQNPPQRYLPRAIEQQASRLIHHPIMRHSPFKNQPSDLRLKTAEKYKGESRERVRAIPMVFN